MNSNQEMYADLQKQSVADVQSALLGCLPKGFLPALGADFADAFSAVAEAWRENPHVFEKLFDGWKQSFSEIQLGLEDSTDALPAFTDQLQHMLSIYQDYCSALIDQAPGLDQKHKRLLQFYLRQFMSAMEPSNWPLFNPEVLKRAADTDGESIRSGLANFEQDLGGESTEFCLKRCADEAFQLGKNLAATEGEVVYQSELIQLIHYRPTCTEVCSTPMLIVPPCINKFYVLDLTEELSVVKWLVSQGVDLYMISWRNPHQENASHDFSDYVELGVEAAMEFLISQTGKTKLHLAGYCIGGLLATLAAAKPEAKNSIASLTLINTMLDYENPGELGVFISARVLGAIEEHAERGGCLSGNVLSHSFTLLKERQLLWPYVVNRYYLGEEPPADPVMYWNQDVANLPAGMMEDYLKKFYVGNELWSAGGSSLNDSKCALENIDVPVYLLACQRDHIVDWQRSLGAATKLSGKTRQVLASGGHVMGVLNPHGSERGRYWLMDAHPAEAYSIPDRRLAVEGSWWGDWATWLRGVDDNLVLADSWQKEKAASIESAPGSYVKQRVC